jgi:hypothetical protein
MKTSKLILIAAIACLFFGAPISATAAMVEKDGENATAIRDLEFGSYIFDVEFSRHPAAIIYGAPPVFDFNTNQEARNAVSFVVNTLNASGGVSTVGESASTGVPFFSVAYDLEEIDFSGQTIRFVKVWDATTERPDLGSTDWIKLPDPDMSAFLSAGTYAVFTIVDDSGTGNLPPTADADGPHEGAVGDVITFDGSDSSDPDGTIDSYYWVFGDGNTGTGENPSHTYTSAGNYAVTLSVTDANGATDSDSTTAVIGGGAAQIDKCQVKAGKNGKGDSINFSGLTGFTENDLNEAIGGDIVVTIEADDIPDLNATTFRFPIEDDYIKKGKYKSPKVKAVDKSDPVTTFQLDTIKGKFKFDAKSVDLTGLSCPITVTIQIGDYKAEMVVDEDIVNGTKPCPPELMEGI